MRVLWVHNFDPRTINSGVFMFEFASEMRKMDIHIDLYYTGNLRSYKTLTSSQNELKHLSKNYDLLHAQFGSACSYITAKVDKPKIVSLRGSDWHRYFGSNLLSTFHSYIAKSLTIKSLHSFNAIIVMSERMKTEIGLKHSYKNISVLPDPIDLELFQPKDKKESRKLLFKTDTASPWVLFTTVSESNPVKRTEIARKAIEIAKETFPDIELKIANGISRENMPYFISACDLALCTSTHEGWSNSIKEALACNLPFVSTDVSDLKVIAGKYSNCFIADPEPEKLAERICDCLNMKKINVYKAIESMNMKDTCAKILSIYKNTLDH